MVRGQFWLSLSVAVVLAMAMAVTGCKTGTVATTEDGESSAEATVVAEPQSEGELLAPLVADPFSDWLSAKDAPVAEEYRVCALARYANALSLEMKGQSKEAFEELLLAANADVGNEGLVVRVAQTLIRENRAQEAADLLTFSCKRPDASSSIYAWRALAVASAGNTTEAIKIAKTAIKKSKDSALAYQVLFGVYVEGGNTNQALQTLRLTEKQATNSIPFSLEYIRLYLDNRDKVAGLGLDPVAEANRLLPGVEALMKEKPEDVKPEYREMLGNVYAELEMPEKAAPVYGALLMEYPANQALREKYAIALITSGQLTAAEEETKTLVRATPTNPKYYIMLGDIYSGLQNYKLAADFYYYAATMIGKNGHLYYLAGLMRYQDGATQRALDAFEIARALGFKSAQMERLTMMGFYQIGRYEDALAALRVVEALPKDEEGQPEETEEQVIYLKLLGAELYDKLGRTDESIALMEKTLAEHPGSSGCMNVLGFTLADKGMRLDEAYTLIQKAVAAEPDNAAYIDSLAWVLYKMGKPEEALTYQLRVMELVSGDADFVMEEYYEHLGDIYMAVGRKPEALTNWQRVLEGNPQPDQAERIRKKIDSNK